MKGKIIIGLVEEVIVRGRMGEKAVTAKIDTGATKNSVDSRLAAQLNFGPVVGTKLIKSSHGNSVRPVVKGIVVIAGEEFETRFTLADRAHLRYSVLIGQNVLKRGNFLIDPARE